ncbi:MAG TPA: transposase [Anaerolineales bacterium]|nr:transposase [Anaerolineales bacterium]
MNVLAYCLMPTHYHILVRVKQTTSESFKTSEVSKQISLAMQKFLISYTKAINLRFSRVGSLFQGQFQAKPVQTDSYLHNLCLYIHANPVKDRLVTAPEDWIYSNYLEWLGQRNGTLVDPHFIQEHFGSSAEYQQLVKQFIQTRYLPEEVREYLNSLED